MEIDRKQFINLIKEQVDYSDLIKRNIDNGISIMECDLRMGSESWVDYISACRDLVESVNFSDDDLFILTTDIGTYGISQEDDLFEAIHKGKNVELDSPKRTPSGDSKKFQVYVNSGEKTKDGQVKAKLVKWGDPNMKINNGDKEAAKSFRARHKCSEKSDRTKAGWWACNVHRYAKQLGLSSSNPW
jgi:hypothetical protein